MKPNKYIDGTLNIRSYHGITVGIVYMYMYLIVRCHYLVEIIQPRFADPNVVKLLSHQL